MKQCLIILLSLLSVTYAHSKPVDVRIAAYEFPPYYSATTDQHLVGDISSALNALQSDYNFSVVRIAPNGRYDALSDDGCCDVILFEDKSWGWQDDLGYPAQLTRTLYTDHERFVTKKAPNRGQSFFQVKGLRFGGIVGFHYAFAQNEKDHRVLEEKYGVYLTHSYEVNLQMLMNGRLDLIMLPDAYVQSALPQAQRAQLLFDEQAYGTHHLAAVVNANKAFTAEQFQGLLQQLVQRGDLARIFSKYGL